MKKIIQTLLCLMAFFPSYATKIVISSGGDIQAAINSAATGDTIVLTDGGIYSGGIIINKSITLKSENAKILPRVTTSGIGLQGGKGYFFEMSDIEVVGDPSVTNKHMISMLAGGDSVTYLKLSNVVAHDFERTILRMDKATCYVDSVLIDHCHFYKFNGGGWNGFYWRDERVITKYLKISNSTLDGFNEGIIRFDGITFVKKIYIDKCTFNDRNTFNATKDANPLIDVNGPAGSVFKITNCIITDVDSISVPAINIDTEVADTIMNCRFFFDETAVDTTNTWNYKSAFVKEDPDYANAVNHDLTLPRESTLLTAATDGGTIGDPRWIPEPLPDGILAWWKLEETSGNIAKDETGDFDGNLVNMADSLWVKGRVGNAVDFGKGTDSLYMNIADNEYIDFDSTNSFSVSVLVNVNDISGSDMFVVFKGATGKNTPDEKGRWYGVSFKGNELRFVVDDDITKSQLAFPNANLTMNMGGWNHIVAVRDIQKDSMYLYLNGENVASMPDNTQNNITSGPLPLVIGNNQGHTSNFKGLIDELSLYGKVLNAVEIKELAEKYDLLREPDNDSTLSGIKVDGISVDGFSSQLTIYNIELPFGTTTVPTVTAIPGSNYANVTITNAAQLPGSTTITVKAEDGSQLVYSLVFTLGAASADADLTAIELNPAATLTPAFDKDVTSYTSILPAGTNTVNVTVTKSDSKATVTGDGNIDLSSGTGKATIVVTAVNNTTKTYSIDFSVSFSSISENQINGIYAYINNNDLIIEGIEKVGSIEIFDINGKKIGSVNGINHIINLEKFNLKPDAVYFIRLADKESREPITIKAIR